MRATNRFLLVATGVGLACHACLATVIYSFEAPQDDAETQRAVAQRPEIKALSEQLWDLVENRISPLGRTGISKVLGTPFGDAPKDRTLPVFAPRDIVVDGTGQPEFHTIGNLGYLECRYPVGARVDTDGLVQWGWYHRADARFVPLKTANDLLKRLEWDKAKLAEIVKWLDQHLPKFQDLGVVPISTTSPTRVALGAGRECLITTRIFTRAASTNYAYYASVTAGMTNTDRAYTRTNRKALTTATNSVFGFAVDGHYYLAALKLVQQPVMDLGVVQLEEGFPTRLGLGDGWAGSLTGKLLNDGRVGLKFRFRSGEQNQTHDTWVSKSGDSLSFTVGGRLFKITPVMRSW